MRHGSTLVPGLLPDTRDMMTEQVLVMPENSFRQTVLQMFVLVAITFGFVFVFEHFWMMVVLFYLSARFDRTRPTNVEVPSGGCAGHVRRLPEHPAVRLLAHLPRACRLSGGALHPPLGVSPDDVPLPAGDRSPNKGRPQSIAPVVCRPASDHAPSGRVSPRREPGSSMASVGVISQLRQGSRKGARVRFKAPREATSFRVHLFYVTGAAMSLSILQYPLAVPRLPINPVIIAAGRRARPCVYLPARAVAVARITPRERSR